MRAAIGLLIVALAGCGEDDSGGGGSSGSGGSGGMGGSAGSAGSAGAGGAAGSAAGGGGLEWPNPSSSRTSDPWIIAHHDELVVMKPRVLALNFVNGKTNAEMLAHLEQIVAAIREGTRPHGYGDPDAKPFLAYEIAYAIDLRDAAPPAGWPYNNSTLYPREEPPEGYWSFDYEALFGPDMAALWQIEDPDAPSGPLTLCELSERGLVHEVWIYGDADVPDVSAAEVLGIMPRYDESFVRIGDTLDRCAGNGCFDAEDEIPASCTRTLRIAWVNNTRGVGCFLESLSHGIETIGGGDYIPYWKPYFRELAGFDLDVRHGLSFDSWYACSEPDCLSYPNESSVTYQVGSQSGTIDPYLAICGNAHFPPNARQHYDLSNTQPVLSTCETYRRGGGPGSDVAEPYTNARWSGYESIAGDCMGAWLVYWWQSFPGVDRLARTSGGAPMKNWWPFLFH
jgi:hypothetical protein